jgi:hypothetical protein
LIAATLDESSLTSFDEILPLDEGCGLGGEVRLPGLRVIEINGVVVAIGLLVA